MSSDDSQFLDVCEGVLKLDCGDGSVCYIYDDIPCGMDFDATTAGGGSQLPYRYYVLGARAAYAPCCWWQESISGASGPTTFSYTVERAASLTPSLTYEVSPLGPAGGPVVANYLANEYFVVGWAHAPSFVIDPQNQGTFQLINGATEIPTKCRNPDATIRNQGQDGWWPCNGAKTSCPYYTRSEFQYLNDSDLEVGKEILADTVQELRFLSRDWRRYGPLAQERWENWYDLPYIWATDFADTPIVIDATVDDTGGVTEPWTKLKEVWIDAATGEITRIGYPSSSEDGTPLGPEDPPSFPTLVSPITTGGPRISITFPPRDNFVFESWIPEGNLIAVGGTGPALSRFVIINSAYFFLDIDQIMSGDPAGLASFSSALQRIQLETDVSLNVPGFKEVYSDVTRFWFSPGIELRTGTNEILVAASVAGSWIFETVSVEHQFYHVDIIQEQIKGNCILPDDTRFSSMLLTHSSIGDGGVASERTLKFKVVNIGSGRASCHKAYHYYIMDHSTQRDYLGADKPDIRYWDIRTEQKSSSGPFVYRAEAGQCCWGYLDHCRKFFIEMPCGGSEGVVTAKPAGASRSWAPVSVTFDDPKLEQTGILMKVIAATTDGIGLPVRFIIVEPEDESLDFLALSEEALVFVEWEKFEAVHGGGAGFGSVVGRYPDETLATNVAGALFLNGVTNRSEHNAFAASPHRVSANGDSIDITLPIGKFEVSYMAELNSDSGDTIGRKWFYGTAEIGKIWFRDLDIRYRWLSTQHATVVVPNGDIRLGQGEANISVSTPPPYPPTKMHYTDCGDHDMGVVHRHGYLWWPYSACTKYSTTLVADRSVMFFCVWTAAKKPAERYRGPDRTAAFFIDFHATCLIMCRFCNIWGNYHRSNPVFVGKSRLRGPISEVWNPEVYGLFYAENWPLPQLGNRGREVTRIVRTMHFREYLVATGGGIKVFYGWMPAPIHIPGGSIFSEAQPRCFLSQAVETYTENAANDYFTYEGQLSILDQPAAAFEGGAVVEELDTGNRLEWNEVFKRRRYIAPDGVGVRFPGTEWGITFKEDGMGWAWPEPQIPLVRNGPQAIPGVYISKPDSTAAPTDAYSRPIIPEILEGSYTLTVDPPEYAESGISSYACVYLNPDFPVFFDFDTGAIKFQESPSASGQEWYSGFFGGTTSHADMIAALASGTELVLEPEFDLNPEEQAAFPDSWSGIDSLYITGPLISEPTVFVYPKEVDITGTGITWAGIIRGLNLDSIDVSRFREVTITATSEAAAYHGAVFTPYPTTDPGEKERLSGELIEGAPFEGPYSWPGADCSGLDPVEDEISSYGNVSARFYWYQKFVPLRLSLSYTLTVDAGQSRPISLDPSFKIIFGNGITGDAIVIADKPERRFGYGEVIDTYTDSFSADFEASGATSEITFIIFEIGPRDPCTVLTIHDVHIEMGTTQIEMRQLEPETLVILNSKYLVSKGRWMPESGHFLPAHKYLSGVLRAADCSDPFEYGGVCEFWQPTMVDDSYLPTESSYIMSIGKTHKEHACKFDSYDIRKKLGQDFRTFSWNDSNAITAEERQTKIITDYADRFEEWPAEDMWFQHYSVYVHPIDRKRLELANGSAYYGSITTTTEISGTDNLRPAAMPSGTFPPGWQAPGFYGCVPTRTVVSQGCGPSYQETSVCSYNGSYLPAPTLFSYFVEKNAFTQTLWNYEIDDPQLGPGAPIVAGQVLGQTLGGGLQNFEHGAGYYPIGERINDYNQELINQIRNRYNP